MIPSMIVTEEIGNKLLADLVRQVQAGDEIVLTQDAKPVAKLISALEKPAAPRLTPPIRSLKGHRVLTPVVSQAELARELFDRQ